MRVSFHINNPYIGDIIGLSMKILLSLIICSSVAGECMPPFQWPETFRSSLPAHQSTAFDNMAELWYGEISSHHYLPFY